VRSPLPLWAGSAGAQLGCTQNRLRVGIGATVSTLGAVSFSSRKTTQTRTPRQTPLRARHKHTPELPHLWCRWFQSVPSRLATSRLSSRDLSSRSPLPQKQAAVALRELRRLLAPLAECPPGASEGDALFVGLLIDGTDGPAQISRDMPRRLRSSRCFAQCAHFPGSPFLP
jgi:hypothetical protein